MGSVKLYNRKDCQWRLRLGNSLYLLLSFYKGELVVGFRICDETAGDDNFTPANKEGVNISVAQFHEFMKVYKKVLRVFEDNDRQRGVFMLIDKEETMAFNVEKIEGETKYSIVRLAEQKNGEKFIPRRQGALRVNFDEYQLAVLEHEYATIHEKIKELDGMTIISKLRPATTATISGTTEAAAEDKRKTDFYRWVVRDVVLRKLPENSKFDDSTDSIAAVANIISDTPVHEIIFSLSKHHGKVMLKSNPTWDELDKIVKSTVYGRNAIADTIKQLKEKREGQELFGGGIVNDGSGGSSLTKPVKLNASTTGDSETATVSLKHQNATGTAKTFGASSKKSVKIRPDPESDEEDINVASDQSLDQ